MVILNNIASNLTKIRNKTTPKKNIRHLDYLGSMAGWRLGRPKQNDILFEGVGSSFGLLMWIFWRF